MLARVLVTVHPEQLCNGGLSDLWADPRDRLEDEHQMLPADHQFGGRFLICLELVGLPAQ